jgi:deoxyribonuclease-4
MADPRHRSAPAGPDLGAHMSIAGGFDKAAERARQVEATALQVFVKSSNQWRAKPLELGEGERFRATCEA